MTTPRSSKPRADTFKFPGSSLYQDESAIFQRAADGSVTGVRVGGVFFPRLPLPPDDTVFQIKPLKPVEELRSEALASKPPLEHGEFYPTDLVELTKLDPSIKLDIRYATDHNSCRALIPSGARVHAEARGGGGRSRFQALHKLGYGLLIHDAYRPWYVTKMFWMEHPTTKRSSLRTQARIASQPRLRSRPHPLRSQDRQAIRMTGGYDEMSERSYPFYPGGTSIERWHRDLLRRIMEREGFTVYTFEWWHFDFAGYAHYRIGNATFEDLDSEAKRP